MAKGKEQHKHRQAAVSFLGRDPARRSKSRCELCRTQGSLSVTELAPVPDEPSSDHALLLCSDCIALAHNPPGLICEPLNTSSRRYSFLNEAVWSEIAPVQIAAIRSLQVLAKNGASWATEVEETLYIPPDIEARL